MTEFYGTFSGLNLNDDSYAVGGSGAPFGGSLFMNPAPSNQPAGGRHQPGFLNRSRSNRMNPQFGMFNARKDQRQQNPLKFNLSENMNPSDLDIQLPLPFDSKINQRVDPQADCEVSKTSNAIVFSVQTFKCEKSRSILVYNVPKQLKTNDLVHLFSSYGDIEYLYSGRKDDLGVIIVSYFDVEDATNSLSRLSSAAFPVEAQFCVNVVPPNRSNHTLFGAPSSEVEDVLKDSDVYYDERRLLILNATSKSEVLTFCSRHGKLLSIQSHPGTSHHSPSLCFSVCLSIELCVCRGVGRGVHKHALMRRVFRTFVESQSNRDVERVADSDEQKVHFYLSVCSCAVHLCLRFSCCLV